MTAQGGGWKVGNDRVPQGRHRGSHAHTFSAAIKAFLSIAALAADLTHSNFSASSSGRGVLAAFGEPEIKTFVRASIDEALNPERAMSQLRTKKRVVVLHYPPTAATVDGEAPEIFPFLGT